MAENASVTACQVANYVADGVAALGSAVGAITDPEDSTASYQPTGMDPVYHVKSVPRSEGPDGMEAASRQAVIDHLEDFGYAKEDIELALRHCNNDALKASDFLAAHRKAGRTYDDNRVQDQKVEEAEREVRIETAAELPKWHGSQHKWSRKLSFCGGGDTQKAQILDSTGTPLTFSEVIRLLEHDPAFPAFFNDVLSASSYEHFFWECPAVSEETASTLPYEHVTIRASRFAAANPSSFEEHFRRVHRSTMATAFTNLGGDSTLVAPVPQSRRDAHQGHIAEFVRRASEHEQHFLWQTVGANLRRTLQERGRQPTWLSTDGSGVPWLHVRLDSRPKYYKHREYTAAEGGGRHAGRAGVATGGYGYNAGATTESYGHGAATGGYGTSYSATYGAANYGATGYGHGYGATAGSAHSGVHGSAVGRSTADYYTQYAGGGRAIATSAVGYGAGAGAASQVYSGAPGSRFGATAATRSGVGYGPAPGAASHLQPMAGAASGSQAHVRASRPGRWY